VGVDRVDERAVEVENQGWHPPNLLRRVRR
jgi:hypothetical protein